MSILSTYWFEDTDFRGRASYMNVTHAESWANTYRGDLSGARSVLIVERPPEEIVYDLTAVVDTQANQMIIDNILKQMSDAVTRTTGLNVGWRQWRHIGGPDREPGKTPAQHLDDDLLVRVFFDVHVNTPPGFLAVDGRIELYFWLFLGANHRAHARVDAADVFTWGGSAVDADVNRQLKGGLPNAKDTAQTLLQAWLDASEQSYANLYLLPGSGGTELAGSTNAEESVSLALVRLPVMPQQRLRRANDFEVDPRAHRDQP